ncbi:MAG: Txe/YoeB family addiction module toxin [Dysgonamonadaceae bacterium]|jgi:toxin YoeB|nr:Txe/YoeB family addiction module toxin [Dysgonamonadaceae bacterium]
MYKIDFLDIAKAHLAKLKKSEPDAYKKALKLLLELHEHPTTGTGKPEQLKHYETPTWSRRISDRHRLVYQIHENTVTVLVIAAFGHYEDR